MTNNRYFFTFSLLLALLFNLTLAFGQNTGSLKGTVQTSDGEPATYVNVGLKGTHRGTTSDINGKFEIRKLEPGSYTLVVSFIGLETIEQATEVKAGEVTTFDFTLNEDAQQLQEVIVSSSINSYKQENPSPGLRLKTPLLQTPQNIQVIPREVLLSQQSFDMLEGIQRNVSGAQKVEHWDNYARINMRGSQITAFRNGMNVQMPWGPLAEDMSMVDRIEFVKGPAGFVISTGEPGGFYNVVTKKPTGQEKGEVSFTLGSFDTYRATADYDGVLSRDGRLQYRLNVMGQLKGSHRDYEYNNRYTIAPVLKYLIDDKSSITVEYTNQYSQMNVIGSNYAFSREKYADLPVNFTTAEANLDPTDIKDNSVMAMFEHSFDYNWRLTAQAGYFHYNQVGQSIWPKSISTVDTRLMQRGISIWDALSFNKTAQVFLNGNINTFGVIHNVLGGIDMSHKDYYADWNQGATLGDSTFNIYNPEYGKVGANQLPKWDRSRNIRERGVRYNSSYSSAYFQDEIGLFDNKLRVTIAGRYTANKYVNPYSGSTNDGKFTPRAGLSYSIRKNTCLYFVYDQAFLANPGTDWQGNNFDPITGDNLEVGVKKNWFGGKWNTAISAYQITKNNVLTTDLEHPNEAGQFVFNRQNGQQKVKGVEFDVKGEILPGLSAIVNYAYTDANITKDSNEENIGNQVAGATKHLHNVWLTYKIREGVLGGLSFSAGYQYQSGRSSWFIFDGSENSLPDYFRLDAAVSYTRDKFTVNLNVNNILNEYLYSGAPYYGMFYWQTEPPRNGRLSVSYKF